MKKRFLLITALIVGCGIVNNTLLYSNSTGAPGPYTGYAGQSCALAGCHSDNAVNSASGTLTIKLLDNGTPITSYTPGKTYQVSTNLVYQGAKKIGFASEVLNASNIGTGTMGTAGSANLQKFTFVTNRPYITHTPTGCASMQNTGTYTYSWIAPVKGTGSITIYSAGNAANGDGYQTGDHIFTKTLAVTEATSSIEEQSQLNTSLNVYPNPTSNQINLEYKLPVASHVNVQLWGIDGKLIRTLADAEQIAGKNSIHTNISDLASGTYLVKVSAGEYSDVQRVVKN